MKYARRDSLIEANSQENIHLAKAHTLYYLRLQKLVFEAEAEQKREKKKYKHRIRFAQMHER